MAYRLYFDAAAVDTRKASYTLLLSVEKKMEFCKAVVRPLDFSQTKSTSKACTVKNQSESLKLQTDCERDRDYTVRKKSTVVKSLEDAWRRRDNEERPFKKLWVGSSFTYVAVLP